MHASKKQDIILFLLAVLAGFALHSLYRAAPLWPAALAAPIRESIWEHLKLLFWPYLSASVCLRLGWGRPLVPRLFALLLMCAAMLAFSFWYHIVLGGDVIWADIALYLVLMTGGFLLPLWYHGPQNGKLREAVIALAVLLAVLILLFTFFPPDSVLFWDLRGANTWTRLPC